MIEDKELLEDAIKHFKSLQKRYTREHNGKMCTKVAVALEAMEKQILKKPVRDNEWHFNLLCPCCNRKIADTEHRWDIQRQYLEEQKSRCSCGQAILWEE